MIAEQKKEQGPMGQSFSGVWEMGKARRQKANTGGLVTARVATTFLLSSTLLRFSSSQMRKNIGSYWQDFCLFCQHHSKDSPRNKNPGWIVASKQQG